MNIWHALLYASITITIIMVGIIGFYALNALMEWLGKKHPTLHIIMCILIAVVILTGFIFLISNADSFF